MKNFSTKNFAVIVGNGQARGTWYVLSKIDDTSSYRQTGSEGEEEYYRLKAVWRKSRLEFDSEVTHTYLFYQGFGE